MTTDEIIDTKTAALLAELEELVTKRVTAEAYADALNDIAIRYGTPILMAALLLLTVAVRHADSQIATHGRREAEQQAAIDVLKQEVRELEQQRDGARTELRDVITAKRLLQEERDTAVAQLAGYRVLFEEQGRALTATRASVTSLRERLDQYMPIDSVLGDWQWSQIVEDGCIDDVALMRATEALAHIEREQAKTKAGDDMLNRRCPVGALCVHEVKCNG